MNNHNIRAAAGTGTAIIGAAGLVTTAAVGPTSVGAFSLTWLVVFAATTVVGICWWSGYAMLYRRLARGSGVGLPLEPARGHSYLLWPAAILSISLLPDAAVVLSGRLPYTLQFDEDLFRAFRFITAAIVGGTLLVQEMMLLEAARGKRPLPLLADAMGRLRSPWAGASRLLPATRGDAAGLIALVGLLTVGALLRLRSLDSYHYGDMDVMLSLTYNLLGWPPVAYYHNYVSQTWVYNHLPFFPIVLAPFYWLFENVLRLPTAWAAKLLIGVASEAVAVILYRQAGRGLGRAWGLAIAALWVLSPWTLGGDDHPIPFAIAFALGALASLDRPWLCGLLLALGVGSRNEVAFLAVPMLLHFVARRPLPHGLAFAGVFGTVLAIIALPFALFDPSAMDYALRRQLQRDAAGSDIPILLGLMLPYAGDGIGGFLRQNPGLVALAANASLSLLVLRERRVPRVALIAMLGYLLTLPLVHERYVLFTFAVGLFYAARFHQPLAAVAVTLLIWLGFPSASGLLIGLVSLGAALAVLAPRDEDPMREPLVANLPREVHVK